LTVRAAAQNLAAMRARWISSLTLTSLLACGTDRVFQTPLAPDSGVIGQADAAPNADADTNAPDTGEPADSGTIDDPDTGTTTTPDAGEPADSGEVMIANPPPTKPYSAGTCPTLVAGPTSDTSINTGFMSGGAARSFRLMVPMSYDPTVPMPVVFAWHWLNASSGSFVRDAEMESAIAEMGMIAVLPDGKQKPNGDKEYLFDWPFVETMNAEEELSFFDDLLTCVSEQYNVDLRRVYGIGVSAGALWLTYMMSTDRIDYFAAVESLSGGLGEVAGFWQMTFTPRPYKFPAIVLWGGPSDRLGVNFAEASMRLESELTANGQFVVECVHTEGHAVPPIEAPNGSGTKFWSLWQFMLDHPYGATSPYVTDGLPTGFPSWCRIP
jgi:hypothetical protein